MAKNRLHPISIKFPPGLIDLMDNDIEETEEFRNRSEFIIAALREYITKRAELREILKQQEASKEDFASPSQQSIQNNIKG